jgi:stearoyl-CoA desaturase (delta-9 desaturase)
MTNTRSYVIFSILLTILGVVSFYFINSWWLLIPVWLFRTIGNGVVGHRYFAHNQFEVGLNSRKMFAYYTSICGYSTPFYWIVQHLHHHRNSDQSTDIHSPKNGIWNSIVLWMFKPSVINSVFEDRSSKVLTIKTLRDDDISNASKRFIELNVIFYVVMLIISPELFLLWSASYVLELIKFGSINSILHLKHFPGNYKNHDLKDDSHNNLFLGFITMGFGWHNNHHNDSKKLNLREKWWEVDIEYWIGILFSKIFKF